MRRHIWTTIVTFAHKNNCTATIAHSRPSKYITVGTETAIASFLWFVFPSLFTNLTRLICSSLLVYFLSANYYAGYYSTYYCKRTIDNHLISRLVCLFSIHSSDKFVFPSCSYCVVQLPTTFVSVSMPSNVNVIHSTTFTRRKYWRCRMTVLKLLFQSMRL